MYLKFIINKKMNLILKKVVVTISYTIAIIIYIIITYIYLLNNMFKDYKIIHWSLLIITLIINTLAYISYIICIYSDPGYINTG
jgi:hypothetical protein